MSLSRVGTFIQRSHFIVIYFMKEMFSPKYFIIWNCVHFITQVKTLLG